MITQEYLKSILSYNPKTGLFKWKERSFKKECFSNSWNTRYSNKTAGTLKESNGYVYISILKKNYFAHRLVWLYVHGEFPETGIDHINGIKHDNRFYNLRTANQSENCQNVKRAKISNKSTGLLGSSYNKQAKKYISSIQINGKRIYLGLFITAIEAHKEYLNAKRKLHSFNTI